MKPVIIFYPFGNKHALSSFSDTGEAIRNASATGEYIHTTQMCFLTDAWDMDFDVWIVDSEGMSVNIKNGMPGVDKQLTKSHNLFRLWRGGVLHNKLI